MIVWLVPICLFWLISAVFFGGMYDAEDGSSGRQALGLLVMFGVYLVIFFVLRLALGAVFSSAGPFLSAVTSVALPAAIPAMLLGRIGKITFGMLGVRITRSVFSADAH